jgi:hypothetical protein
MAGYPPPYYPLPEKRHGGLATAALVLGIVGLVFGLIPGVCWFIGWPCGVLAIIFGGLSWKGWGKAKAGLILGVLAVIAGTVWLAAVVTVVHHASTQLNRYELCIQKATTSRQVNACDRYVH